MNFGTKIRQRREQLGLSQQELARRMGMTQARISEIESGARPHVNLTNLRNFARTLGVSADYLIGTWDDGEAPMSPAAAPQAAEVPATARGRGRPRGPRRPPAPAGAGSEA
jgi:transcriptional regulator with XRE-family HTH domain